MASSEEVGVTLVAELMAPESTRPLDTPLLCLARACHDCAEVNLLHEDPRMSTWANAEDDDVVTVDVMRQLKLQDHDHDGWMI